MTQNKPTPNSKFTINENRELNVQGSWKATQHKLDEKSAYALEMALVTGRPLLVRGEPGIGKSQLARYAADVLDRLFLSEVVNINTEGQDLLWRYDPVARLNDAQLIKFENSENKENKENKLDNTDTENKNKKQESQEQQINEFLNPKNYLNPGILWWVYDWTHAESQYNKCRHKTYKPQCHDIDESQENQKNQKNQKGKEGKEGIVLLIDEIDKADPSLPNSLLEVLGNGGFYVPMLGEHVSNEEGKKNKADKADNKEAPPPLIIITTNDERVLPPAFVRRCLVLDMKLDDKEELYTWWHEQHEKDQRKFPEVSLEDFNKDEALAEWLRIERAEVHYPKVFSEAVCRQVAQYLIEDRRAAQYARVKPGQAEYLDLLAALSEMTPAELSQADKDKEHLRLLDKIRPYALSKGENL